MLPASASHNCTLCGGLPCAVNRPFFVQIKFCADARKQLRAFLYYERTIVRSYDRQS